MAKTIRLWSDKEKEFITKNITHINGVLYWLRDQPKRGKAGEPVNVYLMNPKPRQYYYFALYPSEVPQKSKQTNYRVSHVVWFLEYGYQSEMIIDHINTSEQLNNSPSNLRQATTTQNRYNQKHKSVKNTEVSPYKGVTMRDCNKKYWATIRADGQSTYLGSDADPVKLARRYDLAATILHGEFACLNFPDSIYSPDEIKNMTVFLESKRNKQQHSEAA